MNRSTQEVLSENYSSDGFCNSLREVITEKSIGISVNALHWVSLMCTPSDLDMLAVGFLYDEGIINSSKEIKMVEVCPDNSNVDVWLNHNVQVPSTWYRTSGCAGGITSVVSGDVDKVHNNILAIQPNKITRLVEMLLYSQVLYTQSGGVHSSALSDGNEILVIMEDIGRHNTLDKIAGKCLMDIGFPSQSILLTTGRISSEMLQKASRIGANMVISRTAPTSLAISSARNLGICLIGYARKERFTIYTNNCYVLRD